MRKTKSRDGWLALPSGWAAITMAALMLAACETFDEGPYAPRQAETLALQIQSLNAGLQRVERRLSQIEAQVNSVQSSMSMARSSSVSASEIRSVLSRLSSEIADVRALACAVAVHADQFVLRDLAGSRQKVPDVAMTPPPLRPQCQLVR